MCKYSDITTSCNLDSLEKNISTSRTSSNQLFMAKAILEKSRLKFGSCKFGSDLKQLDSLAKIINTDTANLINLVLAASFKINNFDSKISIINDLNNAAVISEKLNDTLTSAFILYKQIVVNIMGEVYLDNTLNSYSNLIIKKYYDKILNITKNTNNSKLKLIEKYAKIEYFLVYDTSCEMVIKYALDALELIDNCDDDNIVAKNYLNTTLSSCYNYKKDFKTALLYSKKNFTIPATECSTVLGNNLFCLANCYYEFNQNDSALKYYLQAIEVMNKTKPTNLLLLENCYDRVSVIQYYKENYKQAFEDLYVRDSLFANRTQKEKNNLSVFLQHKYEYENNVQKIALLEKQKKKNIIIMVVGLIVFIIITLSLIFNYRQNKRLNLLVNFRNKILAIISHDLRSPLYALQGLNQEASYLIRNNKVDQFMLLANSIDESSIKMTNLLNNLLLWSTSITKKNKTKQNIFNVAQSVNNAMELYNSIALAKRISIHHRIDSSININANKYVLKLIIRNWIDNTIKYANATTINISAIEEKKALKILLSDNGFISDDVAKIIQKQLKENNDIEMETGTGLGLGLISYFCDAEGWSVSLQSNTVTGNHFTITIPHQS